MTVTAPASELPSSPRPHLNRIAPPTASAPRLRPRSSRALVFPGQGSQRVGMGRDLAAAFFAARAVFDEVDEALGERLSRLMFEGPIEDLTRTENAQPALMAMGAAIVHVLEDEFGLDVLRISRFVAGHSVGEYSALVAAGSLTLMDAAQLLRRRGLAMAAAAPDGVGTMATLIGLDLVAAQEVARAAAVQSAEAAVCVAANDNAPGQVVISGNRAAIDRATKIAEKRGARRVVRLSVSGPFHSPLMQPVAEEMAVALASVRIERPVIPLISNVTAQEATSPDDIRQLLVRQVTGMVRWRESCLYLQSRGVDELVEMGPGTVLAGLAKRINRHLSGTTLGTAAAIEAFARNL